MSKYIHFASIAVFASIVAPAVAKAECSADRLVGAWRAYAVPTANSWLTCSFVVGRDGALKSESKCAGSFLRPSSASGKIAIQNCVITGQFTVDQRKYTITHAGFSVDQSMFAGVLRTPNGRFTEIKSLRQ